jgi:hypothetical protein
MVMIVIHIFLKLFFFGVYVCVSDLNWEDDMFAVSMRNFKV